MKKKELTWLGKVAGIPRIFDGKHSFKFTQNDDGTTTLIHEEHFRGILVRFMKQKLDNEIIDGFRRWNATLKTRAEKTL